MPRNTLHASNMMSSGQISGLHSIGMMGRRARVTCNPCPTTKALVCKPSVESKFPATVNTSQLPFGTQQLPRKLADCRLAGPIGMTREEAGGTLAKGRLK